MSLVDAIAKSILLILQILHLFYKKLLAERSEASPIKLLLPRSAFLVMRSRIGFSVAVYPKRSDRTKFKLVFPVRSHLPDGKGLQ